MDFAGIHDDPDRLCRRAAEHWRGALAEQDVVIVLVLVELARGSRGTELGISGITVVEFCQEHPHLGGLIGPRRNSPDRGPEGDDHSKNAPPRMGRSQSNHSHPPSSSRPNYLVGSPRLPRSVVAKSAWPRIPLFE